MNGMRAMFEDMRRGGGGMSSEGSMPPSGEGMGMDEGGIVCPSCGAKFVMEKKEEEEVPEGEME